MEQIADTFEYPAALADCRGRLLRMAMSGLDTMEQLPPPKSCAEVTQLARAIATLDRTLVQLYTPPKPPQTAKPRREKPVASKPAPPKLTPAPGVKPEDDPRVMALTSWQVDREAEAEARRTGAWADGTPFEGNPDHGAIYPKFAVPGFDPSLYDTVI